MFSSVPSTSSRFVRNLMCPHFSSQGLGLKSNTHIWINIIEGNGFRYRGFGLDGGRCGF